jgi:glucokinase
MKRNAAIGIDIGGSKTILGLFSAGFRLVEEVKFKTQPDQGKSTFLGRLAEASKELLRKADKRRLSVVTLGVGCAGSIDEPRGTIRECPNIPFLRGFQAGKILSDLADVQVHVTNDVHAGLYGEHQLGAAVGRRNVLGVFLGTGVGGAVILEGRLYRGSTGDAGNIGNYLMHASAAVTDSQREGVLDDIVSRTAIAGEAATLAAKQWAPHLLKRAGTEVAKIKSNVLAKAIDEGDHAVEDLVKSRARLLGIALSNIANFLNPDMIVLGGGLVEAMPTLIRREVRMSIDENASPRAKEGLEVVVAKLKGHAVTAGAAKLAMDSLIAR